MTNFKDTGECPRRCRRWTGCSGKDFYNIQEICYCFSQVEFLIKEFLRCDGNEIVLERETWPDNKTDEIHSHGTSNHAPYEAVMMVIGELRARLALTGLSGQNLVLHLHQGTRPGDDARWALGYVAGNKRKKMSFSEWKKQKKQRR